MLSEALATAAGSRPCGSGTSMWSAHGTRTRSDRNPPQSPPTAPKPYIAVPLTERQLPVRPRRHDSHSPHDTWNGTLTRVPGLIDRTPSPTSTTSATPS